MSQLKHITSKFFKSSFGWLSLILLLAALQYAQVRNFSFLNYDDGRYVADNIDIRDFSWSGLSKMIFHPQYSDELIPPFTTVTLAMNYAVGKLNPSGYHLVNLLFHLANIVLVFFIAGRVFKRRDYALWVAAIFAFHPSSVEAIAWVAARKEVQYTFFYLLALWFIFKYWDEQKMKWYIAAILLFVVSYYSKFAAASFPVLYIGLALLWKNKKNYGRILLESVPFFIFPLYSIVLMFYNDGQVFDLVNQVGAIGQTNIENSSVTPKGEIMHAGFSLWQKIILGGYSFMVYLYKFIWPFDQQIIYPYPELNEMGSLPFKYSAIATLTFILVSVLAWFGWKNRKRISVELIFGAMFFLVHIVLVLHVLPLGGKVVVADRYTYLPYLGLSVILVWWLGEKFGKTQSIRMVQILGILLILMNVQLIRWIPSWKDSGSIFTHLVEKEPMYVPARISLGKHLLDANNLPEAEVHLKKALQIDSDNPMAYLNMGTLYLKRNQAKTALKFLAKGATYEGEKNLIYYNIGQAYVQLGDTEKAKVYFQKSLEADRFGSITHVTLYSLGQLLAKEGSVSDALKCFEASLERMPDFIPSFVGMANTYIEGMYSPEQGLEILEKAREISPEDPILLQAFCQVYLTINKPQKMYETAKLILSKNPNNPMGLYYRGVASVMRGNPTGCSDLVSAANAGVAEAEAYHSRHCR